MSEALTLYLSQRDKKFKFWDKYEDSVKVGEKLVRLEKSLKAMNLKLHHLYSSYSICSPRGFYEGDFFQLSSKKRYYCFKSAKGTKIKDLNGIGEIGRAFAEKGTVLPDHWEHYSGTNMYSESIIRYGLLTYDNVLTASYYGRGVYVQEWDSVDDTELTLLEILIKPKHIPRRAFTSPLGAPWITNPDGEKLDLELKLIAKGPERHKLIEEIKSYVLKKT